MTRPPIDVPVLDVDYYGREALLRPARIYEQIREPAPYPDHLPRLATPTPHPQPRLPTPTLYPDSLPLCWVILTLRN